MLVTVTCSSSDGVYSLEVSPDMELENFKVLVGVESGMLDQSDMVFFHSGRLLTGDKKTLTELGVADNDMLLYGALPQATPSSSNRGRSAHDSSRMSGRSEPTAMSGVSSGMCIFLIF